MSRDLGKVREELGEETEVLAKAPRWEQVSGHIVVPRGSKWADCVDIVHG